MIVQATQLPNIKDLMQTLRGQFANYSVYTFESKPQKSIIVRKSAIIGAQVTVLFLLQPFNHFFHLLNLFFLSLNYVFR